MVKSNEGFLPQAPSFNRNAILRQELISPEEIRGGTDKLLPEYLCQDALELLVKRRDQYRATKNAPFAEIEKLTLNSRSELVVQAAAIISQHALAHGAKGIEAIHRAALAGCGDTVALLELIARMQGKRSDEVFNEETYRQSAKKSLPTLLYFASTSDKADGVLTTNISTWTREEIEQKSDEELFIGVRYDDSFFIMQDDGAVILKGDKKTSRKIFVDKGKNFDFSPSKHHILFGCPFRQQIVFLYPRMLNAMINNEFAQEAYALAQREVA